MSSRSARGKGGASAGRGLGLTGEDVAQVPLEVIRSVIRSHAPAIRTCYEASLRSPPYPKGRVEARFVIGPTGQVRQSCLVSTTLNQPIVERCIVDETLKWQFPPPARGGWVIASYPWVLETRADTTVPSPGK